MTRHFRRARDLGRASSAAGEPIAAGYGRPILAESGHCNPRRGAVVREFRRLVLGDGRA